MVEVVASIHMKGCKEGEESVIVLSCYRWNAESLNRYWFYLFCRFDRSVKLVMSLETGIKRE